MDDLTSTNLLDYAVAHPFDGTQEIKLYQHQEGHVTITLYVDMAERGHLSLTVQQKQSASDIDHILSQLALPNCRYIEQEERKGYIIHRYQFDLPQEQVEITAVVESVPVIQVENQERPSWNDIEDHRCHICHRELSDPVSLSVKIGSVCRQRIEKAEEKTSTMWEAITQEELEAIWTTYNIYDKRRRERAKSKPTKSATSRFISPPITSYSPPPRRYTTPTSRPVAKSQNIRLVGIPEGKCLICGQITTDYWYFDGKTKTCKCRSCYRQKKS